MPRRVVPILGALLVLFHAWLLGSQLWDGQLSDPGLLLRWGVAGGLLAALAGLRRRGLSVFWGRRAVSIWLLAALLHGPAMAGGDGITSDAPALPEAVTAALQIAAASIIVGLGLLGLLAARVRRDDPRTWLAIRHSASIDPATRPRAATPFAPRPPPVFFHVVLG
jgi:hypothetical protein